MSKNIKALYDGKQYDLVIKYGLTSSDEKDKLYVLSAYMVLGQDLSAINFINSNLDSLFKEYPLKTMRAHFELLLKNKLYKDAYKALDKYQDKPYVSQEVEEFLRDIKERIIKEEHPSQKAINSIDEILEILENSSSNIDLSRVLFSLKDYSFNLYAPSLEVVIKNVNVHPSLRTYALIVMVENKYDKEIEYIEGKFLKRVNPSKLTPPFVNDIHQNIASKVHEKALNDITLENTALQLLNYYVMDIYPHYINEEDEDVVADALLSLGRQYLSQKDEENRDDVLSKKKEIETIINATPTLEL